MSGFADDTKQRLIEWAAIDNIDLEALEVRHGKPSWVLKEEFKRRNLYAEDWWAYIEGKEHRWARALNSSQCFAVNLFAPLADNAELAAAVLIEIAPELKLEAADHVAVAFEYTPAGGPDWLGERGQPTQVDVAFEVRRNERLRAALLVEVKFTENGFGSCRGFAASPDRRTGNPDPSRCLSVADIVASPEDTCWLAEHEGRAYWRLLQESDASLSVAGLNDVEPCPFRGGLYQIMRNAVLADEFRRQRDLDWSGFALCVHPGNDVVWTLDPPANGANDIRQAMPSLLRDRPLHLIDPRELVDIIGSAAPSLGDWASQTRAKYFL